MKNSKIKLTIMLFVFFVTGCSNAAIEKKYISGSNNNVIIGPKDPPIEWKVESATSDEVNDVKMHVKKNLKDPDSARFDAIWAMQGSNNGRYYCGHVNAKNSYGGYTGKKLFTIDGGGERLRFSGSGIIGELVPSLCSARVIQK